MNKALFALLIVILLSAPALALPELGARPVGMGGAFVGLADDVNSIFVNPAGVASIKKEAALVSTRLVTGRELTMIGGVENTGFGSFGVGYVGASDLADPASLQGDKITTQTLYVTLAEDLNQKIRVPKGMGDLSLGVNLKFSSRKTVQADGLTADRGANVDMDLATVFKPNDSLSFGLSMQNLMNGKSTKNGVAPATGEALSALQAGVSGKLFDDTLTWALQDKGMGCEWQPAQGLSLRVGRSEDTVTTGFGLNLGGFSVDYAFAGGSDPTHYWSVSIMPPVSKPLVAVSEEPAGKTASVMPDDYRF